MGNSQDPGTRVSGRGRRSCGKWQVTHNLSVHVQNARLVYFFSHQEMSIIWCRSIAHWMGVMYCMIYTVRIGWVLCIA